MAYRTVDPTSGELLETFAGTTDAELERALDRAARAFEGWRHESVARRSSVLERAAQLLDAHAADHAELMATEMGKPVAQGEAESRKCASGCRWVAENAEAVLACEPRPSDAAGSFVSPEPLGPLLAIMPWNFPYWQVFRFGAAALAAGNAILLKHAPSTPRCAERIERLLAEAGLPAGVLQNVRLSNEQAARAIADPRVRGVTLTGSTRAGREVAATAGRHLKKMVLELGGSDPFVVFADADLGRAASTAVEARCVNSGQSCIAAKRLLVERPVLGEFRERFVAGMRGKRVGNPRSRETEIGPLARADLRDTLARQVEDTVAAGARVLCGGTLPAGAGFFYPPTVLDHVPPGSPASCEELFGPVAALFPFDGEDEALALANCTAYGLGAALWTADRARARRLVPRLEAGMVFVNGLVKSDPRLPVGGVKDSGFGRELSREGLLEFTNVKTVWQG
jgi:succinate-semialdehyde dehydrogenase/glutarate-semialdehyde dehydrogenase